MKELYVQEQWCRYMTDAARDLETLMTVGPLMNGDVVEATPCVRLDLHTSGPLSARPGKLDKMLEQAAALMCPTLAFYAAQGQDFLSSSGRKPRDTDIAQLGNFSAMMATCEAREAKEIAENRADIEELTGQKTNDADFVPTDHGMLLLSDARRIQESGSHIQMKGVGDWRISIGFSLKLYQERQADILSCVDAVFASGVAESANFGFACSAREGASEDQYRRICQPLIRRFQLLNLVQSAGLNFGSRSQERGIAPLGAWYTIDKTTALAHGVGLNELRNLTVYDLMETKTTFIIKLYPKPTLGDLNHQADLAPAYALGAVLAPAFAKASSPEGNGRWRTHSLSAIAVGEQADRWDYYQRFT